MMGDDSETAGCDAEMVGGVDAEMVGDVDAEMVGDGGLMGRRR